MYIKHILSTLLLFFILFAISCNSKKQIELSENEKHLCDSLQFDYEIVEQLRTVNQNDLEAFHYSLSKMYQDGKEIEIDPILLPGLIIKEEHSKSFKTIFALKDKFREKGYSIFLVENNFNINNDPDYIAILKTTDKYEILAQIETNGINYGITTDSLLSIVKYFDNKYALELIGASGDWCEFIIKNEAADWTLFANEVYNVCPDVVDQGVGSIEDLAKGLEQDRILFFWWD